MNHWFRWYEGACEDGKFRMVARNANVTVATVMGVWAILLEDASHSSPRGTATRETTFYSSVLDLDDDELCLILDCMEEAKLIRRDIENFIVNNWKERQYETDTIDPTAAERQQRWRDKHKQNGSQTIRNAAVTVTSRPDTDTDTDKNIRAVKNEFEKFKKSYPKRGGGAQGWPKAQEYFIKAVKSGFSPDDLIAAAAKFSKSLASETVGTNFVPMAETWLRKQAFLEFIPTAEEIARAAKTEEFLAARGYAVIEGGKDA